MPAKIRYNSKIQENKYIPGDNFVICDRCGFQVRASQTRYQWNNLLVCIEHWEERHPQDFLKIPNPDKLVPSSGKIRVEGEPTYLTSPVKREDL